MNRLAALALLVALSACAAPTIATPPVEAAPPSSVAYDQGLFPLYAGIWLDDRNEVIVLDGEITKQTIHAVREAHEVSGYSLFVVKNSLGGNSYSAQKSGRYLRENQLGTLALGQCASACVDVFAGGIWRGATPDATFGVHRPSLHGTDTGYDFYEIDRAYHASMGTLNIVDLMYEVPADDLYVFGASEALDNGYIDEIMY